jgi:hypothetical protein
MPPNPLAQKPRTLTLVLINAAIWCILGGILAFGATAVGLILLVISVIFMLTITTIGQLLIHFLLRHRRLHPALRTALFFLPAAAMIVVNLVFTPPERPNQRQPSTSPSGKYVLTLPIEKNPAYHNIEVWKVTISTPDGKILYKDDASEFGGTFNAYWAWDDADRVWFYNSDDSLVYFWEFDGSKWVKTYWGYGKDKRKIDRAIEQPAILYPYND